MRTTLCPSSSSSIVIGSTALVLSGVAADTAQEPRKLRTSPKQKARAECSQGGGKTANADCEGSDSFQVSDGH